MSTRKRAGAQEAWTCSSLSHAAYSIEPGKLREMQEPDSGTSLKSDGGNVTSVLQEIQRKSGDDFRRIGETLESIVPNTMRVQVKKHGNRLSLVFTQQWGEKKRLP